MATKKSAKPGPFDKPDSIRTVALEVEGRKFWIPPQVLALYSPVFNTMLFGGRTRAKKAKKETIPLPNKKAKEIEEFLLCLIPTPTVKKIDMGNVEIILKLADEYKIDDLRQRASMELIAMCKDSETKAETLLNLLRIGSKYKLKDALYVLIERCAFHEEIELTNLDTFYLDVGAQVTCGLFCYKLEVTRTEVASNCKFSYKMQKWNCATHGDGCAFISSSISNAADYVRQALDRM